MSKSDWEEVHPFARACCGRQGGNVVAERDLDDYVLAFEEAYQGQGDADPAAFLPPRGHPLHAAVLRELVRVDLEFGWERGCPKGLDDYHRAFPQLADDGEGLREIAYEEYRLRRQAGEDPTPEEYRDRYGVDLKLSAAGAASSLLPWASAAFPGSAPPPPAAPTLPEVGDEFLGFRLVGELGRGAFGRAYLASQGELSDRRVVLKVTAARHDESGTLAQLQHENIMPVYSRHREGNLLAVCMPYLGAVTLREVLDDLKAQGGLPGSGRGLLSSLDKSASAHGPATEALDHRAAQAGAPEGPPSGDDPDVRERLARLSYVEAALWMVSKLADGLAHAHDRGILHLDLKPANVLLADDGRPLLLDFNLSADLKRGGPEAAGRVGGTLPYMAPEHLQAFLGRGAGEGVGARSDLYALGVIAFEMLTGRPPFPVREGTRAEVVRAMIADRQAAPPKLRPWNPAVSPAAEAVIRRCLEPRTDRRYQSARDLAEDLHRHLGRRPLRHTPEPSAVERLGKWARRNVKALVFVGVLLGALGGGGALAAALSSREEARGRLAATEARAAFDERAKEPRRLATLWAREPRRTAEALSLARSALAGIGAERPGGPWWELPPAAALPASLRGPLRREAGELLLVVASAELALATGEDRPGRLVAALAANERAERTFPEGGAPRLLWLQRAEILKGLGSTAEARKAADRARSVPLVTAGDHVLEGRSLAGLGQFQAALARFEEARELDHRNYEAWLGEGTCLVNLGRAAQALTAFTACVALDGSNPAGWFNRGLVRYEAGRFDRAATDFRKADALRPGDPEIEANLGLALLKSGDAPEAEEAFTRALEHRPPNPRYYLLRSKARRNAPDALADLAEGLRLTPDDEIGWAARAKARAAELKDYEGALADLDEALKVQPQSFVALQNKAAILSGNLGRTEDAIAALDRLVSHYPDIAASRASRGVLHARLGRRDAALADVREALARLKSPEIAYSAACALALTSPQGPGDAAEAVWLLDIALREGFGLDYVDADGDLNPIRDREDFKAVVNAAKTVKTRANSP